MEKTLKVDIDMKIHLKYGDDKIRKALNFDIDTKKYEATTGKKAPRAYDDIKDFLTKAGFEHRQGSGYVSTEALTDENIVIIISEMSQKLDWLKECVKQFDVTDIGKQHSLLDVINSPSIPEPTKGNVQKEKEDDGEER